MKRTLPLAILILFGFAGNARADNVTITAGSFALEELSFMPPDVQLGVGGTSFSAEGRLLTSIPEGLVTGMDRPDRRFLKIESIARSPGRVFADRPGKAAATAPESAGMLLLGTGLAAVATVFRRRLKRSTRKPH